MMDKLNEDEQLQLDDLLQRLESQSSMECVVVCEARSGRYTSGGFWLGIIFLWATLIPLELFWDWGVIWHLSLAFVAQAVGNLLGWQLPALNRLLTSKNTMRYRCRLTARAIFQKGRLFQTSRQSAFLIYISWHEQQVVLLWDLGIDMKIPVATLKKWELEFQSIFQKRTPVAALMEEIESLTDIAAKYMPAIAGNANELPNRLNIKL